MDAKEFILRNSMEFHVAVDHGCDIRMDEEQILEWMEKYAEYKASHLLEWRNNSVSNGRTHKTMMKDFNEKHFQLID